MDFHKIILLDSFIFEINLIRNYKLMKKSNYFFSLFLCLFFISCEEKKTIREIKNLELNNQSDEIFNTGILLINDANYKINIDSINQEYNKIKLDSAELAIPYAKRFKDYAMEIQFQKIDRQNALQKENQNKIDSENKKWEKTKAGKIQKKHPEWSKEDCENLANRKIWIGMSIGMLKYQRGTADHVNPSNYGSRVQYQWCWDDYSPSCFYGGEDGIITSYN